MQDVNLDVNLTTYALLVLSFFFSSSFFSPLSSLMQSAAMEETVIWEQHTVTLHRVGIGAGLFFYSIMF